jgi:hypothetical protein
MRTDRVGASPSWLNLYSLVLQSSAMEILLTSTAIVVLFTRKEVGRLLSDCPNLTANHGKINDEQSDLG